MRTGNFFLTEIDTMYLRKGNYKLAEDLIRENKLTNAQISLNSGVPKCRVICLRMKIRRLQNRNTL